MTAVRDKRGYVVRVPHGSYARYTHGGCRCDKCREANRLACWLRRNGLGPGRRERGHNVYGYQMGCRCDECRADHNYWARRLYAQANVGTRIERGLDS